MLIVLANANFYVFCCILVGVIVTYCIVWLSIDMSYLWFLALKCTVYQESLANLANLGQIVKLKLLRIKQ